MNGTEHALGSTAWVADDWGGVARRHWPSGYGRVVGEGIRGVQPGFQSLAFLGGRWSNINWWFHITSSACDCNVGHSGLWALWWADQRRLCTQEGTFSTSHVMWSPGTRATASACARSSMVTAAALARATSRASVSNDQGRASPVLPHASR
jgi:hypothetical protein